MNKKEVQQRVLQNGKQLALSKFNWDEKTKTFSSAENHLVIDFGDVDEVTIISGHYSTQTAGHYSTQTAGHHSTQTAGYGSTQKAGYGSTQTAGDYSTQTAGHHSTQTAGDYSSQTAGDDSTQKAGSRSTQTAGDCSSQTAGDYSTQTAGHHSTQTAGDYSTQTAGHHSTQTAGDCSSQTAGCRSTQTAGYHSTQTDCRSFAIFNKEESTIQICPYGLNGYVKNNIYSETGKPAIIADGILSHIKSKRQTKNGVVYKVINHGDDVESYLIEVDGVYSHGETLKEAKESYKYKITSRDTSQYNDLTIDSTLTQEEAVKLYRTITGACESGTRYFVENLKNKPKKLTVQRLIELTKGQYNNERLVEFFNK